MKHHPAMKLPSHPHLKRAPRLAAALWALCLAHSAPAQPSPAAPVPRPGEELFSDDFERQDLGEWRAMVPSFTIIDGALRGQQSPGAHGAVGQVRRPMRDVVVSFRFKLDGSTTFNAVFDDKDFKGSHGGHICRVLFTTHQIRLGDDKEGVMRNDIFEMTKKPGGRALAAPLLAGRGSVAPARIEQNKWYHATIEVVGDDMRVWLDGAPSGHLKSPGIAHETKSSFHFTVTGSGVLFDDVKISRPR